MTAAPAPQHTQKEPRALRAQGIRPAGLPREIYVLLLIDAQDRILQTVALRAASKRRAVEMGEALRNGTPRAHRYQLWFGGRKVFELPAPSPLH